MPTPSHLSRNIRGWKQKESQVPQIPTRKCGYIISEEYRFFENGEKILVYNSSEDNPERILAFGTQAELYDVHDDKAWVNDNTLKCNPDIHYQLFTLHIVKGNISIATSFCFAS